MLGTTKLLSILFFIHHIICKSSTFLEPQPTNPQILKDESNATNINQASQTSPSQTTSQQEELGDLTTDSSDLRFVSLPFVGTWQSTEDLSVRLFNTFKTRSGKIRVSFNGGLAAQNRLIWFEQPTDLNIVYSIELVLLESEDNGSTPMIFSLFPDASLKIDISNSSFTLNKTHYILNPFEACDMILQVNLSEVQRSPDTGTIHLQMSSPTCKVNFQATAQKDTYKYGSTSGYNTFFRTLMIINFICNALFAIKLLRVSNERNSISQLTPLALSICDMVLLTNMYIPFKLESTELTKGLLFLEMLFYETSPNFLLLIPFWRETQTRNLYAHGLQTHKLLLGYVFLPTFTLVFCIILSIEVFYKGVFLCLLNLYLIPQIIYNAIRGSPVIFDPFLIAIIIGMRPILPLYFEANPWNIFQIKSSFSVSFWILFTISLQVFILYLQSRYGARFFIPRWPIQSHNYLEFSSIESSAAIEFIPVKKVCLICMEELSECPESGKVFNPDIDRMLKRRKLEPGKIMKTKCKHKFHAVCLLEWMTVKMECPKCGEPLKGFK